MIVNYYKARELLSVRLSKYFDGDRHTSFSRLVLKTRKANKELVESNY